MAAPTATTSSGFSSVCGLARNRTSTALRTIDSAIAAMRRTGETYFLSPLLRRRAGFLAHYPGTDPALVSEALREAQAVAEAQGATGFARLAAAQLDGNMALNGCGPIAAADVN